MSSMKASEVEFVVTGPHDRQEASADKYNILWF